MDGENQGDNTPVEVTSAEARKKRVTLAECLTKYVPEGDLISYCGTADEISKYEEEIDREIAAADGRGDVNLKQYWLWQKDSLEWFEGLPANYAEIAASPHSDHNTFVYYKTDTGGLMYVPLMQGALVNSPVGNSIELKRQLEELGFQPHLLHLSDRFPLLVEKDNLFRFSTGVFGFSGFKYTKLM